VVDLARLSDEQRAAATAAADVDLLVNAGPGSGKTLTMTYRIAHLVGACGLPPQALIAVSFTNEAVRQLAEHLRAVIGQRGDLVVTCTLHAFGNKLASQFHLVGGTLAPDEMIAVPLRALQAGHPVGAFLRRHVRHVCVDECQDLSQVMVDFVGWLAQGPCRLTAVGDDAQAIYSTLREAPAVGLRWVAERYPRARTCWLVENRRSTPEIVRLGNALMGRRSRSLRPSGPLPQLLVARDAHDEADWIAAEIALLRHRDVARAREVAILVRYRRQGWLIRRALARRGVPVDMWLEEHQEPADRPGRGVVVTTVHGAKGGEWPVVFVPSLDAATWGARSTPRRALALATDPASDRETEAQRKLLYVAISRPRDRLYLSYAASREDGDRRVTLEPTPLLDRLPPDGWVARTWDREGRPPVRF
jgi:superfamily I DNA/RNA helicase